MSKISLLPEKVVIAPTDEIYIVDHDGSPLLSKRSPAAQILNPAMAYGELSTVAPGTTQTDINTTYKKITQFDTVGHEMGVDVSLPQNEIVIQSDGVYSVGFSLSFSGDIDSIYSISIFKNDVQEPRGVIIRTITGNADIGSAAQEILLTLAAADVLDLRAKTTLAGNHDLTVQTANFIVKKI